MILNKIKKHIKDLYRYPKYYSPDEAYEVYWSRRDVNSPEMNSFQEKRAELLLDIIKDGDSILDVGCGDGRILKYIKDRKKISRALGVDSSRSISEIAKKNGIEVIEKDIRNPENLKEFKGFDYIIFFEVLEHMADAEKLLLWATDNAVKGVVFSVPNTGFIIHRLRLLFGKFPLQWKAHPSEHLRFWTLKDMKWWLSAQNFKCARIYMYEGILFFNKIWPSLFGAGLFIHLKNGYKKKNNS